MVIAMVAEGVEQAMEREGARLYVYSSQRNEVKAKGAVVRKWVQDESPLLQQSHHLAFPSLLYCIYTHA